MKIAIYTDDAPIKEELLAAGLSRINTRIFLAINDNISTIVASHQSRFFYREDLDPGLSSKIVSLNLHKIFVKIINRITKVAEKLLNINLDLLFNIFLPKILKELKQSNSSYLFIPLGSDIRSYRRAIKLSEKTNLPLVVFIGDDFTNAAILANNKYAEKLCNKNLDKWLKQTSKIFVISKGMKEFLFNQHSVESVVLNLPYQKKYDIISNKISNAVFFLGNASHFYHSGLIDMIDVICEYNRIYNTNIFLRFTIDKIPDIFDKHQMQYIKYGKIDTDYNSSKEIHESLFCIIPYSFNEKYKVMVSTSFPSKTMECLAYARNIVVYGPEYSSSVNYFEENNLKTCIKVNDKNILMNTLHDMVVNNHNSSKQYMEAIEKNHSFGNLKSIIQKTL